MDQSHIYFWKWNELISMLIFTQYLPLDLIFLKRSLVFPILLFFSISLHWSLRKAFLSFLAIFWNSVFKWVYLSFSLLPLASLLYSAICKASSDNHFAFLHFFSLETVLVTASCKYEPLSIVLQAFCLSDKQIQGIRSDDRVSACSPSATLK